MGASSFFAFDFLSTVMAAPQHHSSDRNGPNDRSKLAEERLDVTLQSMAFVAHYVGGIDGTFDADEYEEAEDLLVLETNLETLLYDDNPDDDASIQAVIEDLSRETVKNRLAEAIEAVDEKNLDSDGLMDHLKRLSEEAEALNGLRPVELSGSTEEEHRREIKEYVDRYDLDLDTDEAVEMDVLYESLNDEIAAADEPFRRNLAYALVHYGTYIGYASGSLFSSSPYSAQEEEAVKDVGLVYGLPPFNLKNAKLQAEMGADAMAALTSDSFMEELRSNVGL